MINKISKKLFTTITTSTVIIGIGLTIWYFNKESKISLQDVLFWVGAVPIAIFSMGLIGNYMGAVDPSSWLFSRSVIKLSLNDRAQQGESDFKSRVASGSHWIIAGILVWVISYFV